METSREKIEQEWRRLTAEFEPQIAEAREEVEAANVAFEEARERRNAAVNAHKRLQDRYGVEWESVSKMGGR